MSDKILSSEEFARHVGSISDKAQRGYAWAEHEQFLKDSHAAQAERIEELKAAVIRRSGSSSWQEWAGIWDPTEETAVEATKRLFQRAEKAEAIALQWRDHCDNTCTERGRLEYLLRQIREVLPAERAREIADRSADLLIDSNQRLMEKNALHVYAALLESGALTTTVPTWQQQAEQEAADFFEKDGHRWVRMTTEEEAAKRLVESLG